MSARAFASTLEPFLSDWRSIELKVIAEETRDGQLIFNAIRAIMSDSEVSLATRNDLPKIPGLHICHERWELSRLEELLESFSNGELHMNGGKVTVRIAQFNGQNWTPLVPPEFNLRTRKQCNSLYGIDFASYTLETIGSLTGAIPVLHFSTIDAILMATEPPWNGLAELRTRFIGLSRDLAAQRDASRMQLIAPLYVRFGRSSLQSEGISVRVEKTRLTSNDDLRLSVIATTSNQTILRRRYSLRSANESPLQDALEMRIALADKPSRVDLILGYKELGADMDELFGVSGENPRMAVFGYVGTNKLEDLLKGQGDEFEKGVAILFHLLGLDVVHYGSLPGEIPDVVALFKVNKWILVIECAGRELDTRDKLSKLITRSREIGDSIPDYKIYPVIATSLPSRVIGRGDMEKAAKDSIIVITNDEVLDLLQVAFEGITEDELLGRLLRLVPAGGNPWGLGGLSQ